MAKWLLYVAGVLAIMTAGVFLLLRFAYEPTPTQVMSPSFFSQPEDIGVAVFRRFYAPIAEKKLVVVGVPPQPDWQRQIIRGFLRGAAAENIPFDVILAEEAMPPLDLAGLPAITIQSVQMNTKTQAEFIDRLNAIRQSGKRILIYTASVFSSHLLPANPIHRFEKITGEHLFSITTGPLALANGQEHLVDPPCLGSERDVSGTAALGCAFLKSGRGYYRKHIESDRFVAIMNSPFPDDYILLVAAPGQSRAEKSTEP